eukprot:gene22383-34276_t
MSSRLVLAAVALVLALQTNADVVEKANPVELDEIDIYIAKTIITMDDSMPEATAVAVGNGRIVSVGTLESMEPWMAGRNYTVHRTFEDKVIVPGFIEPHLHPLAGGAALSLPLLSYTDQENPFGADHVGLTTVEAVKEKIKATLTALQNGTDPVLFFGYDSVLMGGHLDKTFFAFLEEADAPEYFKKPVAIWDASLHHAYANQRHIDAAGLSTLCPHVPGCQLGTDGQPSGAFLGLLASGFALQTYLELYFSDPVFLVGSVQRIVALAKLSGITTASDVGLGLTGGLERELGLYSAVFNNPLTPMRCVAVLSPEAVTEYAGGDVSNAILAAKGLEAGAPPMSDKLMAKGVKFFSDDALLALTMQMCGNPGYVTGQAGIWRNEPGAQFLEKVLPWWNADFKVHVHSNGDCSQDAVLNLLADLQKQTPRFDHRFTFEHFGVATAAQIRKMKTLGAQASVNMHYPYLRGEVMESFLGKDRAHAMSKVGSLVRNRVPTALHTDTPIAPPKPLQSAWIAVNRFSASTAGSRAPLVLAPEERVSVMEAFRMITIDAAFILGKEDVIGSIEPGKFADFTILECNPFTVRAKDLKDIPVWGTVVGGNVHANPPTADEACPCRRPGGGWFQ